MLWSVFTLLLLCSLFFILGLAIVRLLLADCEFLLSAGLAIVIGGGVASLIWLGLASVGLKTAVIVLVIVITTVVLLGLAKVWPAPQSPNREFGGELRTVFQSVGLGLIGINGQAIPTMTLGLAVLCLPQSRLLPVPRGISKRLATIVISLLGTAAAWQFARLQPGWWIAESNDAPFFEALGSLLPKFGLDVHPGSIDAGVNGYHVITYMWSGILTTVSGLPPFTVLYLVLPFLAAASISLILLRLVCQHSDSRFTVLLVAAFLLSWTIGVVSSARFGDWALIGYAAVLLHSQTLLTSPVAKGARLRSEFLLGIVGVVVSLGKGPAIFLLLLLGVTPLVRCLFAKNGASVWHWRSFLPWHLPVVGIASAVWYSRSEILGNPSPSPVATFLELGFINGLWDTIDLFEYVPTLTLVGIALLLIQGGFSRSPSDDQSLARIALPIVTLGSAAMVLFLPERVVRANVSQHAFYLSLALLVFLGSSHFNMRQFKTRFIVLGMYASPLIAVMATYYYFLLDQHVQSLGQVSRWANPLLNNSRLPSTFLLVVTLTLIISQKQRSPLPSIARTKGELGLLAAILVWIPALALATLPNRIEKVSEGVTYFRRFSPWDTTLRPWSASYPDQFTREVGGWIRHHLPQDALLASNSFCCWNDTDFLESALEQMDAFKGSATNFGEDGYGGSNYLLPSVTQRRFALAGPRFFSYTVESHERTKELLTESLKFGVTGDVTDARALIDAGTTHFIFDKRVGIPSDIHQSNHLIYENEVFAVLAIQR